MKFVLFYQSLVSDWNHGNAHFLRGIASELIAAGHEVEIYEPRQSWSRQNLLREAGEEALREFAQAYPELKSRQYEAFDPAMLDDAGFVIVHEWNEPELIAQIGAHHAQNPHCRLYFHDTHHRAITAPCEMEKFDLCGYDGVLAYGDVLRDLYLARGWARNAWTWHEAADARLFKPLPEFEKEFDLVWIGNWGDEERTQELREFLIEPVRRLGLKAKVFGVRYPDEARAQLAEAGIEYGGWLPNFRVPEIFARSRLTLHIPRRPYMEALPGIPTIRVFEALACGIPLICSPWEDRECLFQAGKDFLIAKNGDKMTDLIKTVLDDESLANSLSKHGRRTIQSRHTCKHRVEELLGLAKPERRRLAAAKARPMNIAFFGSSLVSSYWNGAATYYRGLIHALASRGHRVTFYEPDAFQRQQHRDLADPEWSEVRVFQPTEEAAAAMLQRASKADIIVKASGVGVLDDFLEAGVIALKRSGHRVIFWDVDAPATLDRLTSNGSEALRQLVPQFDFIFTYGGGPPVVEAYREVGARECIPIYNALDPSTHHPAPAEPAFACDLAFLGNRLPDREHRVERFFFKAAARAPGKSFLIGGSGWESKPMPENIRPLGHVPTAAHNAFNCTPRAVLNINRESMARFGYSPATRIFEAAGCGACIISDAWRGIEEFLEPEEEVLLAHDGDEVARRLENLDPARARKIGEASRRRVLREHTYALRAAQVEEVLSR